MKKLEVEIADINAIFISHNHGDHVGGPRAKKSNTFLLSGNDVPLEGMKVFVPEEMSHSTAELEVTKEPRKIAKGIATIGTIERALWLYGLTPNRH
jgi:7,8-dihydropterin-6-yl-methyl-4-(beta-D-ribofuranosyl)aminobenzene 5'-phosphate synthase